MRAVGRRPLRPPVMASETGEVFDSARRDVGSRKRKKTGGGGYRRLKNYCTKAV